MVLSRRRHNRSQDPGQITTLSENVNNYDKHAGNGIQLQQIRNEENYSSSTDSDESEDDELKPSNIHVFSASSTLHGFSHIFASHHSTLRRFSWTVAFLTSLTLFLLQVCNDAVLQRSIGRSSFSIRLPMPDLYMTLFFTLKGALNPNSLNLTINRKKIWL